MKTSEKSQKASYLVAQIIAKNKERHTIAESTIKECCCAIVRTMFGPEFEKEVNKIPLADNTIGRRIQDVYDDIKLQVKCIFQDYNMMFASQLNDSTNISGLAQMMIFMRLIYNDRIIEQLLRCLELPLRTRGENNNQALISFMRENNLLWLNCVGICTDGALSIVGSVKGFTALSKKKENTDIITHCCLHRESLI
ncbi:zinc finger BED domain-containing protein 5-like [Octopus bimaculoides]|uniref:zinc finger BED domain-containing protein 5-like n=1 Tax=Octopus bimaculoides TaxID=37653 RepID=UPI00071CFB20|nr:zinc finger BED domain-containing protein 5-like [Octopus bimaculoides]|eukprot:XP_014767822.1 PREDICTED: zinc finger BED domain-containing protein 5-like [Octopus bimaculoides]